MTLYREFFTSLVEHETSLWNAVDRTMAQSGSLRLGRLQYLRSLRRVEGSRIQDIADALGTTVGAASKLTDRLVTDGLVQRMPHPTDRRSSLVQLTPAGAAALETGDAAFEAALGTVCSAMDAGSVASLTALLVAAQAALVQSEAVR